MGRSSTAFIGAVIATGMLALGSGCRSPVHQRPVEDCETMTDEELRQPIYATAVRLIGFSEAVYVRQETISVVVAAYVNEEGYVNRPYVVRANPRSGSTESVIDAVSQWRFCPALSKQLAGKPISIPFEFEVREIREPTTPQ